VYVAAFSCLAKRSCDADGFEANFDGVVIASPKKRPRPKPRYNQAPKDVEVFFDRKFLMILGE